MEGDKPLVDRIQPDISLAESGSGELKTKRIQLRKNMVVLPMRGAHERKCVVGDQFGTLANEEAVAGVEEDPEARGHRAKRDKVADIVIAVVLDDKRQAGVGAAGGGWPQGSGKDGELLTDPGVTVEAVAAALHAESKKCEWKVISRFQSESDHRT